ncbi:MAG: site-specific DNA-methyltransferase [Deltaproteobacteria bacterium]|nr:site-specific DNA-methyltransferase [Deltaproteobacteria bacterium]MBI4794435.1 site-specific DNA-methyltransferase [Deltaproteobacteria bacterium]
MKNLPLRKKTRTSSFGTPGRISHDSSAFYASKLYAQIPQEQEVAYEEKPVPPEYLNQIFCKSSEEMEELPDNSVHLMVTSPPYNVGKDYDEDFTLEEYLGFLQRVWREVHRVLVPGGRACVNIANLGRKPYIPLHSFIIQGMVEIGFLMRGEIIWNKAASAAGSTAWGSWKSPANPTLRDIHEYILIFSKEGFKRKNPHKRQATINREEFLEYTKSIWTFPAVSARKVGHPAPFPVELPQRLIQLYTYEGEVVLDPFMGSGQAAIAALQGERRYVGYEIEQRYARLAERRVKQFVMEFKAQKVLEIILEDNTK